MANELRHADVGTALSKSEWEAVGGHIFNSQAAGDIMYASTTSQLSRLGIGSANQVLAVNSGATAPEWVTSVASATLAATVTVVDSTDTSSYIAMFDSATGSLAAKTDAGLTYNAGTGMLTATGFTGPLTGTLVTAAQGNVTSLGTLTALTVDDVAIDGKVITMTGSASDTAVLTAGTNGTLSIVTTDAAAAAANIQITADGTVDIDSAGVLTLDSGAAINIEPASGSAILLDGTISIDAGVVTGATSITSTTFVGNVDATDGDFDGTLEADAITVDGTALNEYIADTVGAMVGGNTETRIAVTYDDADNTLDFVVDDMTASGSTTFVLEDDDGTEVTVANSKEVKFIGSGLTTNWTNTNNGTDADPYDLTFTVDAAQTGITSVLNASLVVGRDADNDIDFTTDNNIRFRAGAEDQLTLTDGYLTPSSNAIVDLGTDALEFNNAFFDGTVEADAITIGGTNIVTGSLITTLGTVSAGTWEGTTIAVDQGGTGATSLNNLITLTTHTTGNYVATITGGTGITSTAGTSGEGTTHSLSVDASQTQITAVGTIGTGVWQGTAIASTYIAGDAITGAKIADDAIDSEHYTDGSIDTAHLAADAVTGAKIADDAIDSEHYTDGSIDTAHIADDQITLAKMASGTDGNIISYDASGNPVAIATGNDGQVLTSAGAGNPPAFENASGTTIGKAIAMAIVFG